MEDCLILQKTLKAGNGKDLKEILNDFEKIRLEDVNALSDIAYGAAFPNFKSGIQMILLKFFSCGPSKEDLMFGKSSTTIRRYSEIKKIWQEQTKHLGGPNIPKN